jgi:hypothetical protein
MLHAEERHDGAAARLDAHTSPDAARLCPPSQRNPPAVPSPIRWVTPALCVLVRQSRLAPTVDQASISVGEADCRRLPGEFAEPQQPAYHSGDGLSIADRRNRACPDICSIAGRRHRYRARSHRSRTTASICGVGRRCPDHCPRRRWRGSASRSRIARLVAPRCSISPVARSNSGAATNGGGRPPPRTSVANPPAGEKDRRSGFIQPERVEPDHVVDAEIIFRIVAFHVIVPDIEDIFPRNRNQRRILLHQVFGLAN